MGMSFCGEGAALCTQVQAGQTQLLHITTATLATHCQMQARLIHIQQIAGEGLNGVRAVICAC